MQVVIFGNIKNKSSWRDNNHAFFISFYDNRFIVVYPIFNYFPFHPLTFYFYTVFVTSTRRSQNRGLNIYQSSVLVVFLLPQIESQILIHTV